jgi:hypothetical protein
VGNSARAPEPLAPTKQQLGYLRGLRERRLKALAQPANKQEVTEVAVIVALMPTPETFAMAARHIDVLKAGDVLDFARSKKRQPEYAALLRQLMGAGLLHEPLPTADRIKEALSC